MNNNLTYLCYSKNSKYFAENIFNELNDEGILISILDIERDLYPNGEKYIRLVIPNHFELLGKIAIYVSSLVNDDDILEIERIGSTLTQYGVTKKIFIIPYLAYSSSNRAKIPGEVVNAKIDSQILSMLGSEGTMFFFLDLHEASLLQYFEGGCIRTEIYGERVLSLALNKMNINFSNVVFGSNNLRHTKWVNSYANKFSCPLALAVESSFDEKVRGLPFHINSIVGDVKNKHVILYDDLIRSYSSLEEILNVYLNNGASRVDLLASHLAIIDEESLIKLNNSKFEKIIITNSHPITQNSIILNSKKFIIVDVSIDFTKPLLNILPSIKKPRISI